MELNDKEILITDEDGVETKYQILFTYDNEDTGKQYVLYFDPSNPEEIFASQCNDQHELIPIESEEEWDEVEEVLNTFQEDPMLQEEEEE